MSQRFVHLHVHSHYSLLDGLTKLDELIARTKELGMDAVALTDHGNLYGAIEFYQKAKKAGIKPIIGCEMYIASRAMEDKEPGLDDKRFHLTVLARTNEGYQNLIKLVTAAHLKGYYYKPRIDHKILREHAAGLIALSGCLNGEIPRAIRAGQMERAEELIREYQEIFGKEYFYLELAPKRSYEEKEGVNDALIKLSKSLGVPVVATNDVHYCRPEDKEAQDILVSVQTGARFEDENRLTMREDNYSIRSPEEMASFFTHIPEAIENTARIADSIEVKIELGKNKIPPFETPEGFTQESYLEKLCLEGIKNRYAISAGDLKNSKEAGVAAVRERYNYELEIIKKTGFTSYFLVVQDFVNWARAQNIIVGPGRGSAAGSLISYVLNITNIDPLHYNLLFERFLNPERIAMPDIDLDFADTGRDQVIDYVQKKYGRDKVAQIVTFGTMAARAAIRDTGRALGMSYSFCDQIAKLIPFNPTQGMKEGWLIQCLRDVEELKNLYERDAEAKRLIDAALKLEGVVRHASIHASGLVVAPEPLVQYVPLQYATRAKGDEKEEVLVTQYDMHGVEALGLLKMDFLGLRNLSIIERTVEIVRQTRGIEIDIDTLALDDRPTYKLFQEAKTTGVFQFECLAGDTIVSNTTIEKLYKKGKPSLRSVFLDKGTVHNNKVLKIMRSGKKEIYALIADDGRYIKATINHKFLTADGWKKLENIRPGEKVLTKIRAKSEIWNTCQICNRQIDGQKNGKSRFCYRCSASFYSNPTKEMSRTKMSSSRRRFFLNGGQPWNLHKTSATNNINILYENGKKISKALTGKTLEMRVGKMEAEKWRLRLQQRRRGQNNPMYGKPSPHRKGGYRADLGHYVRSNWEADFARILNLRKVEYAYEPQRFELKRRDGSICSYTPDFYTPHDGTFYEIKGWFHDADKEKIELFKKQHPDRRFVLISATRFAELALQYKNLIAWECPEIPAGFGWRVVKEILPAGKEMTYDIAMAYPANNFIANGFVVHNSSGMKRYLKELKPTELEDLIAMVALYRPGPMEYIPSYINRKHKKETVTYLHPKLEPILGPTYGIGVYQEQMMQIARDLAGFTLPEADTLRKAIGKKIKSLLAEQEEKMITGMIKNGISKETAAAVWGLFPAFARYGFPRAHAACYALVAYQTAYLKAHFPAEYMAALMTAEGFEIERVAFLIDETKAMGIEVLAPDVNESFETFTVVDNGNEKEKEAKIRFGLSAIKNVGSNIVESIIASRKKSGRFVSLTDFIERLPVKDLNRKSIEALAKCGALDSLAERNQILANMDVLLEFARNREREALSNQNSLFGGESATFSTLKLQEVPPADKRERLQWEKELLGLYISEHPLASFIQKLKASDAIPIRGLDAESIRGRAISIGGVVSGIKKIITKSGESMLFVTVEDPTAKTEVLVFPSLLKSNPTIWQMDKILLVRGKVSEKDGEPKLLCDQVSELV
ncbi:MAG: DNA polymerase III subunit alpha [Candidatus Sungbacteria bacterium]|uniref:DNA polymerase III subunit alpha n=1 Tax=Candidatus Sungiibacteriota bacterium TaxID=2750080 RepID=A0A9D6LPW0_9BACT|nr:DNA polymerase III subunit alpha [Candidatus Sungbacteria bacterium]